MCIRRLLHLPVTFPRCDKSSSPMAFLGKLRAAKPTLNSLITSSHLLETRDFLREREMPLVDMLLSAQQQKNLNFSESVDRNILSWRRRFMFFIIWCPVQNLSSANRPTTLYQTGQTFCKMEIQKIKRNLRIFLFLLSTYRLT